ncbi:MAG: hypothetical protein IAI49_03425, partial [Candidatus Eremiobacteraeota bacterium]|nr:hypothetical protein [Candidatus Eremiobacteraeota bacterium]
ADVAFYALQASGDIGVASVSATAPAFSAGLRLGIGGGTFEARTFRSSLGVTTPFSSPSVRDENARTNGVQIGYDLPLGADRLQFAFDRRSELTSPSGGAPVAQTFTTLSAHGDFALARAVALELAEDYSGGTLVRGRSDPTIALSFRPTGAISLRLAAGSAFATAPGAVLAPRIAGSPALLPETAFGYRLTADARVDGNDRLWLTAYNERRFDLFSSFADAANRGVGVGFERSPARGLGAIAYVALQRNDAYGGLQPAFRVSDAALSSASLSGAVEDPSAKERFALTYRMSPTCDDHVGATLLGANDALSPRAVTLGDVSLCVPIGFIDVRIGEQNAFGAKVTDALLAPLYQPHEFTFSLGIH